jgi:predicted Zn-dependent protease with MMP-like domain
MSQVGAGGIKTLGGGRTVLSMEEILESLTTKARVEAEDSQRQLLGALNGLAALMLLSDDEGSRPNAVATYRQALTIGT